MKHIEIALKEYGQKEIIGAGNNPRIVQYSTEIGNTWVTTDEVAWCSEFVNWCLLQAGIKGTKSAVARSFLTWGEETKTPQLGDIVVFWREPKGSANGHVGFYINETDKTVKILGGNQSNEVNIKDFSKENVLSYRKVPQVTETTNTLILEKVVETLKSVLLMLQKK